MNERIVALDIGDVRIGIAVSFGQIEYVSLSGDAQEKNISIDSQTIGFRMNTSAVVGLRFYL